ncbi:MFS transporter [Corynebacterium lowii]|uniref:Methyl viologen resistance protein SmvA n=1 Tax=Corynebacterium lowii TaxID=1544413 RepID=A0A0Q0YJW1_9CORY|nr:MFS transporter [Corynebacterium lowii]KQB87111.1 Methyl viologen resistance protein SmvA [Corynebacterium lowii]MDP9852303.1 MFS family permease [Corynebacterium lowii]
MGTTAETAHTPEDPPPSRWTLPLVLIAQFVTPMSIAGTAIALPKISADLGAHPTALQWVVNGFNVAFAFGVLAWGALSDRIGYRATFAIGGSLFAIASLLSAISSSLLLLDGLRAIAGVGAAAVLTGSSSMLSNAFEGSARARAFALFGTVNGLGLALGPTISGLLITGLGWRGVFTVHGLILAVVVLNARILPRSAVSGALGDAAPLLDWSLLRNREFLAMCLVPVAGSIGFVTLLTYLPSALSAVKDVSAGQAGLLMLAMTLPVVIAPSIVAKLVESVPSVTVGTIIYASLISLVLGNLGLTLLTEDRSVAWIILPMILLGCGFGLPVGLVDGHALHVVPPERTGTAAGLLNFFRIGSEAVFVAGYAFVLSMLIGQELTGSAAADTAAGQPGHPDVYTSAFATTMFILAFLVVIVALIILAIRRNRAVRD